MTDNTKRAATMMVAVLNGPNDLELTERPVPVPGPGEVLLKVEGNTLCGTDGRLLRGEKTAGVRPGVIPGHEFAGRITALGEGVNDFEVGKQAVVFPIVSCGHCADCLADREELCPSQELFGYAIDGGLAEYCLITSLAVERGNLIQVDEEISPEALSLVEPISCCLHGFHQYGVNLGDSVLIFGAGPIGLIHAQLARAAGAAQIIVTNRSPKRRELAMQLGATHTIDPTAESVPEAARRITGGRGADVAVVCVGVPELANEALQSVRGGGRVNYFAGFPKGSTAIMDPNLIHYEQLVVTGGSGANRREAHMAVDLLQRGVINADVMVTHTYPLSDLYNAYEELNNRDGLKILVVPDSN